ncbi:MAG: hypothetical protein JWM76_2083 [Pseudonocardiales bacterium]|nr:hypothetical protein [Pseudonocardiales bacterium]
MIVVLAGASGLIGSALKKSLRADGHSVRVLVRREPGTADEHRWDPDRADLDPTVLRGADAVVNLCGVGVGDKRWTDSYKELLLSSRVNPTRTLADAIAALGDDGPPVFLSASAVGYYGDTGDQVADETAPPGRGFFPDLCVQWEAATASAEAAGRVRVVHLRTGLVLSPQGGLLGRLKPLVNFGLGGRLGSGRQFQPWISIDDEVGAIRFLLENDLNGPVNLTAPGPVRQKDFVNELAHQLHRPAIFPAPRFGLRLVLGQFADEGVLVGQRAVPAVLERGGYPFTHKTLADGLQSALA